MKYSAYSLALLATLASCNEADVNLPDISSDRYIVFGSPGININATIGDFADNGRTRAELVTSIDKFTVWGYCVPNDISGKENPTGCIDDWNDKSKFFTGTKDGGSDLINLAKAEVNPLSNNYNGGRLTEWNTNTNASYSFIAGAGNATFSMEKASASTTEGHGPRLKVTLPASGNSTSTALNRTAQPDVLVAAKFDHKQGDGHINLSFFHIMTALRFKFKNYSDKDLIITGMTFSGTFHKEAILDFTTDDPVMTVTTNKYSGSFTIISQDSPQTITHGSEDFAGGDSEAHLLLLPNPEGTTDNSDGKFVLGSNKSIDIYYHFADDPAGTERHFTTADNFTLNYLPQPNTLHTAHFNFIGDNFVLTFQADDTKNWQNGSDNDFIIK